MVGAEASVLVADASSISRIDLRLPNPYAVGRCVLIVFQEERYRHPTRNDPFRYLSDVLRRLPTTLGDRMIELLPDVWFETHPQAARKRAA
jgi:hypothetical protein